MLLQAVILITSHNEQGTAGVILNKPLEHLIGDQTYIPPLNPATNQPCITTGLEYFANSNELLFASQESK